MWNLRSQNEKASGGQGGAGAAWCRSWELAAGQLGVFHLLPPPWPPPPPLPLLTRTASAWGEGQHLSYSPTLQSFSLPFYSTCPNKLCLKRSSVNDSRIWICPEQLKRVEGQGRRQRPQGPHTGCWADFQVPCLVPRHHSDYVQRSAGQLWSPPPPSTPQACSCLSHVPMPGLGRSS